MIKPLYLLIKIDVDDKDVSNYDHALDKYANNFCNNMEFELIDYCLEEKTNPYLYISGFNDNA
tara:strand:+ start:2734 stop:2922 length:189 start_codon:yes stop_codon:yes gene_type:complete